MYAFIPVFDDPKHPVIGRLLKEKALRCPECGEDQASLDLMIENRIMSPRYAIACGKCKHLGPIGRDAHDAIRRWNKPPGFFSTLVHSWARRRLKRQKRNRQTQRQYRFVP
jgi:hypothetical protein